jgi:predicted nucleotidyltransferase
MIVASIIAEIVETIEVLTTRGRLWAYLFGSALHSDSGWSDIDILIVCEVGEDGQSARNALSDLCLLYPIDLVIMTFQEETEFDFVRSRSVSGLPPVELRRPTNGYEAPAVTTNVILIDPTALVPAVMSTNGSKPALR